VTPNAAGTDAINGTAGDQSSLENAPRTPLVTATAIGA
jgi:hypothetical protein